MRIICLCVFLLAVGLCAQTPEQIKINHEQLLKSSALVNGEHFWVADSFSCPKCGCPAYYPAPGNMKKCVSCGFVYSRAATAPESFLVSCFTNEDHFSLYTETKAQRLFQEGSLTSHKEGSVELLVNTKLDDGKTISTIMYSLGVTRSESMASMKFSVMQKSSNAAEQQVFPWLLQNVGILYPVLDNFVACVQQSAMLLGAFAQQQAVANRGTYLGSFRFTPGYLRQPLMIPIGTIKKAWEEVLHTWNVSSYKIEMTWSGKQCVATLVQVSSTKPDWGVMGAVYVEVGP